MGRKRQRKLVAPGSDYPPPRQLFPCSTFQPLDLLRFLKLSLQLEYLSLLAVKVLHILNLGGDNLNLLRLKNLNRLHFMELHRLTVLKHKTLMETQKILLS
ncbi:hypothetical protein Bca52824_053959 [Brassica carinata]|uniref:Uncharacterized protein n=1 Tax=Brassica carinata TaxID=52824 RepID=A0A8X7R585_BRACI|nr:hypothetical protein Bca52824_053959 [Brassica carinata]